MSSLGSLASADSDQVLSTLPAWLWCFARALMGVAYLHKAIGMRVLIETLVACWIVVVVPLDMEQWG